MVNADFTQSGQVRLISGEYKGLNGVYQMYDYDANGNVSHTYDGKTQKHRYYHYDGLNQLVREDNEDAYLSTVYSYDNGGNILSKTVYAYNAGNLGSSLYTVNYGYNDVVWGDKLTSYNNTTITYDNIGNPLSYRNGMSFTWEQGRQMKTLTNSAGSTWEYSYDASGYRTKKKLLNTTYEYMLDGSQVVCMKTPTRTVWFYYDAGGQRVAMDVGGTVYYYIYNLMGDVVGLYDGSGNVVARYAYDAWGRVITVKDGSGNILNPTANPGGPGIINPFRYRGYMYDDESGLYYLNSRYYDPETGRFVNADAVMGVNSDITAYNLYAYCANNPITRYDENGMFWEEVKELASTIIHLGNSLAVAIGIDTAALGAAVLNMQKDSNGVYHADFDCWQQYFGYNDLYDIVFDLGTSMKTAKFEFSYNGTKYVIWAWKGDYINLGAGAELGIYYGGGPHWLIDKSLSMPMHLRLDYNGKNIINYGYVDAWWITGFNPNYQNVLADNLTASFSIIFPNQDMFNAFWGNYGSDPRWYTFQHIDAHFIF